MVDKNKPSKSEYKPLFIAHGDYGWESGLLTTPSERASYLWQLAVTYLDPKSAEEKVKPFEKHLERNNIEYEYDDDYFSVHDAYYYGDSVDGYVDHADDGAHIVKLMQDHEGLFLRFIYGDKSLVITGNDNDDSYTDEMVELGYATPSDRWEGCYDMLASTKDVEIFEKGN